VTHNLRRIAVVACLAVLAWLVADGGSLPDAFASRSPIARQPRWLQVVELVVLSDLVGYWIHRAKHEAPRLWRWHRIHHAPQALDWLSAARVHPLDDVIGALLRTVPLFVLGFEPEVMVGSVPGLALYALLLHANVRWSFGPLRCVVASPVFHRWHHSRDKEALDKNFAPLLPLWDLLFGTFYMPPHRQPEAFGVTDAKIPTGFWAQLRAQPIEAAATARPVDGR
jgi:sterol desaturase/sphingolipid hydroxylase (fatty acid hydroxylase superfamily)